MRPSLMTLVGLPPLAPGQPAVLSLAQWQKAFGQDEHSPWADPRFVTPQRGNYRLSPGRPLPVAKAPGGG